MAVVFVALIGISYLIDLLRIASDRNGNTKGSNKANAIEEKEVKKVEESSVQENLNDEELVAVISAAVAVSLGVSIPEVNIKSIKRVTENTPAWAAMGRREQILGKL
jgi:Na+-transporting methylmalonyl-CoA/oxaloacetate decarboxylase gamma subunit